DRGEEHFRAGVRWKGCLEVERVAAAQRGDRPVRLPGSLDRGGARRLLVAAEDLRAPVDHRLRRVDVPAPQVGGVSLLPFGDDARHLASATHANPVSRGTQRIQSISVATTVSSSSRSNGLCSAPEMLEGSWRSSNAVISTTGMAPSRGRVTEDSHGVKSGCRVIDEKLHALARTGNPLAAQARRADQLLDG